MRVVAELGRYSLAEFVTAIASGLEPLASDTEEPGRLSDERNDEVTRRLRELEEAQQLAEAASRDYHVR